MESHQSGSCKSGESYREGFVPSKVEEDRLFFGAAFSIGGYKWNRRDLAYIPWI